jgi:hypothetical protein
MAWKSNVSAPNICDRAIVQSVAAGSPSFELGAKVLKGMAWVWSFGRAL